jgi:hypothetical protein
MGLYNRSQLEKDLAAVEAFDQEISRKVAAGEISGFVAVAMGREVEKKIRSLRMKLVNAGQLIGSLKAAEREWKEADDSQGAVYHAEIRRGELVKGSEEYLMPTERGKKRLKAMWNRVRWNSTPDGGDAAQASDSERLEAPRSREFSLDDPEAQIEIKRAENARKRMLWRPRGRNVVIVYDD